MRSALASILMISLLSGCTTAGKAPACAGPHRPANPFGSVLSPKASEAPTPAPSTDAAATPCAGGRP